MDATRAVIRRMLTEARPRTYTDIGHRLAVLKDFDAWRWSDGKFTFASEEGVDPSRFHSYLGVEGPPQFAGRIDYEKRMASIASWAFQQSMADKKAVHIAKRLAERLPDDFEIWYFPWGEVSGTATVRRLR